MLPTYFLTRIVIAGMLLLTLAAQLQAQGVGGTRGLPGSSEGIHTIQGRVFSPDGRPLAAQLRVRLEGSEITPMSTVTDTDGTFVFARIPPGSFRVTVEGGTEYENATDHPSIYREASTGGRIVRLTVFMRPKNEFGSIHREAVEAYQKSLELDRAGENRKAVDELNKALAIYPKFGPALNHLGVQYLKLGQPDKAAEALEAAVRLASEEFLPRLNYGIALLNQKKFELAEEQLRAALLKNDASPSAHMYLGIALMSQKKLDEAEKELLTAVSSNSNEVAPAHRYLGGVYWAKRDYQRAADQLEIYLKLVPKAADSERTRTAIKELRLKG